MKKIPPKMTKIVCTIGPSSDSLRVLKGMISSGMNIARLNFAHGDEASHERVIKTVRAAAEEVGERVAIMADLPGPKLRIGRLASGSIDLMRGQKISLQAEIDKPDDQRIYMNFPRLTEVIKPGDQIYLSDGFLELQVEQIKGPDVICIVKVGGELRSNKGVNLPGVDLGLCAFTENDRNLLAFAKEMELDAVSQSFVQDSTDILQLRTASEEISYRPFIIAKIERASAVDNLDEILKLTDGIMVARGDLGVEIPIEKIAVVQKEIIRKANIIGKPVITATHMLESMIDHNRPTRAEATDVANAILDGTDCVMLSGETAMGKFPIEAIEVMSRIAVVTEPHSHTRTIADNLERAKKIGDICMDDLISLSIYLGVEALDPVALITPTMSGATSRRLSRFRLPIWIFGVSPNRSTCNGLVFSYGVYPILEYERPESWAQYARDVLNEFGISGELAMLTKGTSAAQKVGTNEIEIIDLSSADKRKIIW